MPHNKLTSSEEKGKPGKAMNTNLSIGVNMNKLGEEGPTQEGGGDQSLNLIHFWHFLSLLSPQKMKTLTLPQKKNKKTKKKQVMLINVMS